MTAQTKIVELYTLSTCPWCRKAKAYLDEKRVKYSYIDYDLADEGVQARIQDEMMARGAAAFPFAVRRRLHRGLQPGGLRAPAGPGGACRRCGGRQRRSEWTACACGDWSGWADLNRRPLGPEPSALPS